MLLAVTRMANSLRRIPFFCDRTAEQVDEIDKFLRREIGRNGETALTFRPDEDRIAVDREALRRIKASVPAHAQVQLMARTA